MSEPKVFDFSNGAQYTVTICNDRAVSNLNWGGDFEFQHTWLILTDNSDPQNPVRHVLSYISKEAGGILDTETMAGKATWEKPEDPSYIRLTDPNFRMTEAITIPVENVEAFFEVISEEYKENFLYEHRIDPALKYINNY